MQIKNLKSKIKNGLLRLSPKPHTPYSLKGVGILEALIYVAIVSLLTVIVVNMATVMTVASGKTRLKRNIIGEAGIATERMMREIRLADSLVVSESVLGVHPGVLKLNTIVGPEDTPTTREFYISENALMMKEVGGAPVSLTEKVAVTNFVFYHIGDSASTSEAVALTLTAEDEFKSIQEKHTFNATAVMRRSY